MMPSKIITQKDDRKSPQGDESSETHQEDCIVKMRSNKPTKLLELCLKGLNISKTNVNIFDILKGLKKCTILKNSQLSIMDIRNSSSNKLFR